jgi:LPXTG-motif cell wall-anchored protein
MYTLPVTGASALIYAVIGTACLIGGLLLKVRTRRK